jgi:hypothetical protein
MIIYAVDPGNIDTGYVVYNTDPREIVEIGKIANEEMREHLKTNKYKAEHLVIEMIASYGMPVGASVFETCVWIGRYVEVWGKSYEPMFRKSCKMAICGSMKANDSTIRRALIDIFEPDLPEKKRPSGPLKGVTKDMWAALALAVTYEKFEQYPVLRKDYGK